MVVGSHTHSHTRSCTNTRSHTHTPTHSCAPRRSSSATRWPSRHGEVDSTAEAIDVNWRDCGVWFLLLYFILFFYLCVSHSSCLLSWVSNCQSNGVGGEEVISTFFLRPGFFFFSSQCHGSVLPLISSKAASDLVPLSLVFREKGQSGFAALFQSCLPGRT